VANQAADIIAAEIVEDLEAALLRKIGAVFEAFVFSQEIWR